MNFAQFVERYPKTKRFAAVYGPDEYLVHTAKTLLVKDFGVDPLDTKVFEFPEDFSRFCDALHEQPLVGDKQLLVGRNFDKVYEKLEKVDFKNTVPKSTCVLLTSFAEKLDTKNDFAQLFISRGWWIWAKEMDPDQEIMVLQKLFGLSKYLAEKMIGVFGSMARAVSESKKLRLLGMMNVEGFSMYSEFVAASEDDYVDKVIAGDTEGSVRVMNEILNRGDSAVRFVGMVAYKLEQAIRVMDELSGGFSSYQELGKMLGIPVPFLDKIVRRAKKLTLKRAFKMLSVLEEYDLQLRKGYKEDRVLVSMTVVLSGGA